MSAYDSPTIIQDQYGASGWANFAEKIATASVNSANSMAEFSAQQAAQIQKEADLLEKTYASFETAYMEGRTEESKSLREKGTDKGLIDQFKDDSILALKGGKLKNGKDNPYGIGVLRMKTALSNPSLSQEKRIKYQKLIDKFDESMADFPAMAANIISLKSVRDTAGTGIDNVVYAGTNEQERALSMQVSNALLGNGEPIKGITSTKTYGKDKDGNSIATIDIVYDADSSLLPKEWIQEGGVWAKYYDKETGKVTPPARVIDLKKPIHLLYAKDKGLGAYKPPEGAVDPKTKLLTPQYQMQIGVKKSDGKGGFLDSYEDISWANIKGVVEDMKPNIETRVNNTFAMMGQGQEGNTQALAHLRSIGLTGIDYLKKISDGDMTADEVKNVFREAETAAMQRQFGIGSDIDKREFLEVPDPDNPGEMKQIPNPQKGKSVAQKGKPPFDKLEQREVTQDIIDALKAKGVIDLPALKSMGSFYVKSKAIIPTTASTTTKITPKQTQLNALNQNINKAFESNDISGMLSTTGGKQVEKVGTNTYRITSQATSTGKAAVIANVFIPIGKDGKPDLNSKGAYELKRAFGLTGGDALTNSTQFINTTMTKDSPYIKVGGDISEGLSGLQNQKSLDTLLAKTVNGIDGIGNLGELVKSIEGFSIKKSGYYNDYIRIKSPVLKADGTTYEKEFELPLTQEDIEEVNKTIKKTMLRAI